jgi:hypothetical protein
VSTLREKAVRGAGGERGFRACGFAGARRVACWLVVALGGLLWSAGGAFGVTGHSFVASLSEAPVGTGLVGPMAVAVDRGSGRVFVGDPLAGYVDVYDGSGEFVTRFGGGVVEAVGVAVDEASGDVYVADPLGEGIEVYAPDGKGGYVLLSRWWGEATPSREFGEVAGVAVDNSAGASTGDVYVLESRTAGGEGAAIDVYRPAPNPQEGEAGGEGTFLGRLSGGKLERPNGIAVSAGTGRVLVADSLAGAVLAYSAEGAYEGKLTGKGSPYGSFKGKGELGNVAGVAVDEGSGDIYVAEAERHAVSQYTSSGEWEGWITTTPAGDLGEPRGVALSSSGDVYVADAGMAVVDRFGPGTVVPGVETGKVAKSGVTRTSAVLPGVVNGEGKAASYRFQYGETGGLGSETSSQPAGTGEQAVSTMVGELEAGHAYYYRIVGENENGSDHGLIRRFETAAAVGALTTGPVSSLTPETVMLTGSLKREGLRTYYYFQYGTTSAYSQQAPDPAGEVPAALEEKEEKQVKTLETVIGGLTPNTLYHYRLVAENKYGTTYGADRPFTTPGSPTFVSEPVSEVSQTGATLHAQIDPDGFETSYRFQYGETTAYDHEAPEGGEAIGSGTLPVARSTVLSGLRVGATYHYRVLAENQAGTTIGPDHTFTTIPSAPVDAIYATSITSTEAVLHALINPLGHDTHVYFQYGTQPCQNSSGACINIPSAPGNDIGEASEDVPREERLTGLEPDTTYHYRVIAANALGTTDSSEHLFTTQPEANGVALPDNRAWEMVTPPGKGGASVEALTREGGVILAAENGNAVTYVGDGALGSEVEGNRSPEMQQVLATRTSTGWANQDIATPNDRAKGFAAGNTPEYQFFTPDLSTALVEPAGAGAEPPLAEGVTQNTPYLRDNSAGTYLPLVTEADTAPGTQFDARLHFLSAAPDLNHVVITSEVALTGPGSSHGLYEWSGGKLQFVSVMPSGKPAATPELGFFSTVLTQAISNDGSRVFWTNKEDLGTRGGHLYMRDTTRGETIRLDAAQGVAEPEKGSAQFQAASSDGSRVFFLDKQRLTADSTAEAGQGTGQPDLYECQIVDVAGKLVCGLQDLTVVEQGGHANVQGLMLAASEDGTSVFLIAHGVLASNANGNGEHATPGRDNLYEIHYDGTHWTRTFIATLSEADSPEWEGNQSGDTAYLTARVSPNGRYFAFMSQAPITGYDNIDANPAAKGARDEEVYLYDSKTATLRCVSCNPSGARPKGVLDTERGREGLGLLVDRRLVWGREGHEHWLAGNIPGWTAQSLPPPGQPGALFQARYLSDEGRLYFNSPDSLVPAAENGKEDVYQYEPSGVGDCQSSTGGCVSLLSGGSSDRESAFLEATPDGSSVFFLTEARLLPSQDTDTAFDIYDARECTPSSPCLTPPPEKEAPCAETETCRPAQPSQPIPGGPAGSAVFSGPGNAITPPPAAKHEVEASKASKPQTRAEKLKRALRACRTHHAHSKRKREACERTARKRYAKKHQKTRRGKKAGKAMHSAKAGAFSKSAGGSGR